MPANERPFSDEGAEARPRARRRARGEGEPDERAGAARRGRGLDKRERILRAAIKVFARKGFYATRVSEIARAAGVADGTIYLYFDNKEAVLVSIFEDRISRLIEVLRAEVERAQSFEAKFRRVVELQLGLLEGQRDLAEVVTVNLRQSSRLLKQYAAPLFTRYLDVIATLIAEGQQRGIVRPDVSPRLVARALWGALDGIAVTWALDPRTQHGREPGALQRAASQVARVFLDGVRAHPAGAAEESSGA